MGGARAQHPSRECFLDRADAGPVQGVPDRVRWTPTKAGGPSFAVSPSDPADVPDRVSVLLMTTVRGVPGHEMLAHPRAASSVIQISAGVKTADRRRRRPTPLRGPRGTVARHTRAGRFDHLNRFQTTKPPSERLLR